MRLVAKIGVWYFAFVVCAASTLWFMPDSWRVHPKLSMPKIIFIKTSKAQQATNPVLVAYLRAKGIPVANPQICVVGDSAASLAPWPYAKIDLPGKNCLDLPKAVAEFDGSPNTFIVLIGTWLRYEEREDEIEPLTEQVVRALRDRFPQARIIAVPFENYRAIAQQYTIDDGWHLDHAGYEAMWADCIQPLLGDDQ